MRWLNEKWKSNGLIIVLLLVVIVSLVGYILFFNNSGSDDKTKYDCFETVKVASKDYKVGLLFTNKKEE